MDEYDARGRVRVPQSPFGEHTGVTTHGINRRGHMQRAGGASSRRAQPGNVPRGRLQVGGAEVERGIVQCAVGKSSGVMLPRNVADPPDGVQAPVRICLGGFYPVNTRLVKKVIGDQTHQQPCNRRRPNGFYFAASFFRTAPAFCTALTRMSRMRRMISLVTVCPVGMIIIRLATASVCGSKWPAFGWNDR